MKPIRCIVCRTLFTHKELEGNTGCPICDYHGMTMLTKGDVSININWLELRILCMWSEQLALQGADENSMKAFYSIVKEIKKQLPNEFGELTQFANAMVMDKGLDSELPPEGTTLN